MRLARVADYLCRMRSDRLVFYFIESFLCDRPVETVEKKVNCLLGVTFPQELPVENLWKSWWGRSPVGFGAKTILSDRVKFSTNSGQIFHRFFHRPDRIRWHRN